MNRAARARTARALPSPFRSMVGFATRQVVGGRRWLPLLVLVAIAAIGFGLLAHEIDRPRDEAFALVASGGLFGLVIPLTCLVIGDAVLGADIRAGTFPLTWLSPVPITAIVVARWLAGWLLAGSVLAAASALCAVAGGSAANADAAAVSAAAAAGAYVAVFVFLGAATRRATIWGLVLIYLVEQLLGGALTGIAQLSPQWLGRGVYAAYASGTGDLLRDGVPTGAEAMIRLAIVAVAAGALAVWRIRNLRLTGGRD